MGTWRYTTRPRLTTRDGTVRMIGTNLPRHYGLYDVRFVKCLAHYRFDSVILFITSSHVGM